MVKPSSNQDCNCVTDVVDEAVVIVCHPLFFDGWKIASHGVGHLLLLLLPLLLLLLLLLHLAPDFTSPLVAERELSRRGGGLKATISA